MLHNKLLTGFEQCSQCVQSYPVDSETRHMGYMVRKQMSKIDVNIQEMYPVGGATVACQNTTFKQIQSSLEKSSV